MQANPIIVGLSGLAGTGKTSVAEAIVPKGQVNVQHSDFAWDHIFFALPLYELATIKKDIRGLRQKERQLYEIHRTLYDLYGGSPIGDVPDYDDLFELVHAIQVLPIETDVKPRTFLQTAGDLCRAVRPNCFAEWAIRKAKAMHREYLRNTPEAEQREFGVFISDVRFANEAETILDNNGILINYKASDNVRFGRLYDRDGYMMSEAQMKHKSEQEMDIVSSMAHTIIDTDSIDVVEQATSTIQFIKGAMSLHA